jgi:thioredoxin-related protein
LKQLFIIIVFFTVVACKSNEEADKKSQVNVKRELIRIPTLVLILQNIMSFRYSSKGDTFGTIINEQNIEDRRIYDIVEKVKDTLTYVL